MTMLKSDYPRSIDCVIDYFGDHRAPRPSPPSLNPMKAPATQRIA